MDGVEHFSDSQPDYWNVCFVTKTQMRWLDRLIPGRFKHVRVFGFLPHERLWVFYEVTLKGTRIMAARDKTPRSTELIAAFIANSEVMRVKRGSASGMPVIGWCVPAVKRLVGVRSGALLPGGLWRDCLAQGGTLFDGGRSEPAGSEARPSTQAN